MLRMAKLTDYGILLLAQFAARHEAAPMTAREVSVAQIIEVLEGPMALTECQAPGVCDQERHCSIKPNWLVINRTVRDALSNVTLEEMARPMRPFSPAPLPSGLPLLRTHPGSATR